MSNQKKNPDSGSSVSRSQSREVLDSSSTSSLSVFADHSDGQNSMSRMLESHVQKSGECSPSLASVDEALKSEAAFIQYLTSIPAKDPTELRGSPSDCVPARNRSPAVGSSNPTSKVGLDHLDNLCKLMEQLGELRDTNSKLQKRVQYLEDLKTLHDMHKEICEGGDYSSEDALSSKHQAVNFPLQKSATETHCPNRQLELEEDEVPNEVLNTGRSPSRYLSRRSRHQQSGGGQRRCRSKSVGHEDLGDPKSRRIFPKWSRVKEAFGWESERKGSIKKDDSVFASRRRSDESRQTYRHLGRTSWYQECPSVQSSVEDINECDEDPKEKSFTLERDPYSTPEFSKFYKEDVKRGKSPWGRVKTIIERHRDSLKRKSLRRDQSASDLESAIGKNTVDSLDFKAYDEFLESQGKLPSPTKPNKNSKKPGPLVLDPEDCAYPRTPSSSPNQQRKSRWNRVTQVLKGKKEGDKDSMSLSTPNTPNFQKDGNFTFDAIEEMSQSSQGDTRDISRVGSDSHVNQLSMAMPSTEIMLQLQRNLSEDFHKKIMEWDRIRASSGTGSSPSNFDARRPTDASRSRKKSGPRDDKVIKPKLKDLTWLEKELQKIEKEKQRLAKERQKYEERAHRLEKLKETVLNANSSNKREVLVRTSAGEFRFEGISDAFTKKLYEWETKRGVGPELSTIALLDSSRLTTQPVKIGPLQRVLSRSESSVADIGQPSHNSSNSLPSVKMPEEVERMNQASRANSEPDLATLAAFTNGAGISVLRQSSEVTDADLPSPEVSKESEEDDFDKPRKGSETYYGLLEENVILLEQLKEKEEICRRLEEDLGVLDKKMDDMNNCHLQETQRYREKLWEMHRQGATPRDVVCCRRTMEQLRKRIETLEKWTKKLRNDRDTIEINFRHHSKEQESMTLDLLGKMRELQAVGSSEAETNLRDSPRMDAKTIERLQDLSALLTKQTLDLEERLSEKTRQICHLKWELLHRDLSDVKQETEQHTHSANKKRSKYAHWRSRSSEEPTANAGGQQKTDPSNFELVATEVYGGPTTPDELKATYLANTVQQLNKELMKLTSNASITSLSKYFEDDSAYANAVAPTKSAEVSKIINKSRVSKTSSRKITVRRSSAGNLSLLSTDDNRKKNETTSSTDSDDSSDEYYSRVSYNTGHKSNFSNNASKDGERLLMSYGEHLPRASNQRKKKFQKLNSSISRKRSNTFHTNRDLQKPNMSENFPQKCQSFRVARENYLEDSLGDKTAYSRRKVQNSHFNIRSQDIANYKTKMDHKFQEAAMLRKSMGKVGVLENYNINWLREVSSDSKLPILMQAQISAGVENATNNCCQKSPTRSMSDKTKNETASERREHLQKRRSKKRLKSPDPISIQQHIITDSNINYNLENMQPFNTSENHDLQNFNQSLNFLQMDSHENSSTMERLLDSTEHVSKEVPTITIQLPKRKHRKSSCEETSLNEITPTDEQTFTIVIPKKRSLSSECESSISENSPRDTSVMTNYDQKSEYTDSSCWINPTERSSTAPQLNISSQPQENENGSIRLMRLVSLNNFETPFDKSGPMYQKEIQHSDQYPNKRKAEGDIDESSTVLIEKNSNVISNRETQKTNANNSPNFPETPSKVEHGHTSETHYVKSPSAPQLDWRKVCAKKVSKSGAPNVRTLIERYNQKVIESQLPKSPASSNVSSPATTRKISNPVGSCSSPTFIPRFCSTPNTPTSSPSHNPLIFSSSSTSFAKSPPSSPASVARAMALSKAKEHFIASQSSTPTSPVISQRLHMTHAYSSENTPTTTQKDNLKGQLELRRLDDDLTSNSSMDSMNLVMMRAGENCRESRLPKRPTDPQRSEATSSCDRNNLKTSKSLSSSSLFKSVLNSEFKMPSSLLRLKRSKRKKDMSTVTELCRQSLLLTTDDVQNLPPAVSHKSCPNSPELKSKSAVKSSWLQRNIFRHK